MNFVDINKNKISLMFLVLIIVFTSGISDSFAQLPTGPIEITIENVTINTPAESSTDESEEENKFLSEAIIQGLSVIGVVIAAVVGLVVTYFKIKIVPSTLEQENLFNKIMQEAYYESYLPIWRKIWEIIASLDTENRQERFIDYLWKHYFGKRLIPSLDGLRQIKNPDDFPVNPPLHRSPAEARDAFLSYAILKAKKFHLNSISKEDDPMREKLTYLFNKSDAEYYLSITKSLPDVVKRAVSAADNPQVYKTSLRIDDWKRDALKDLKRLMIYAFLREDEKVLEIMILKEINEKIFERIKKA